MKKPVRKLELKMHTIVELTTKDLETANGAGRSRTGACPVYSVNPPPPPN